MLGRLYTGSLFGLAMLGAAAGAVAILAGGPQRTPSAGATIVGSGVATVGFVMLLNLLGLGLGKKSIGAVGLLISAALLGVGVYWLFLGPDAYGLGKETNAIIMASLTASGIIGVLSSLGVTIAA